MSAFAPFNVSYTQRTPYLTVSEYMDAPTAIDTSNLLPSGSATTQEQVLAEVIASASSLIDQECVGPWGTLCATVDIEPGRVWASRDGTLRIHPQFWPILEVRAFSYGATVQTSASISPAGNVWIEPRAFIVSFGGIAATGFGSLAGIAPRCEYYCSWTYVNGWPNTTLAASVAAGAASVTPVSVVGIYPGSQLTIYDTSVGDEAITVASGYTPGGSVVPLVSPVGYSHAAGVSVTNLPPSVKQAAISLTTVLIKERGSGALEVNDLNEVTRLTGESGNGAVGDMELALMAIRALKTTFQGY